jgi:hypothetical protein
MSDRNIHVKLENQIFNFKLADECINFKLKDCGVGPVGATGTTGAASTVVGPTGAQGLPGTTGATGTTGAATGTMDHAELNNKDYDNAGHTGFQKQMVYTADFKAYEIE